MVALPIQISNSHSTVIASGSEAIHRTAERMDCFRLRARRFGGHCRRIRSSQRRGCGVAGVTPSFVVPAKAGIHNHRSSLQTEPRPRHRAAYRLSWLWIPDRARYARLSGTTSIKSVRSAIQNLQIAIASLRTRLHLPAARIAPGLCKKPSPPEIGGRRECRAPGAPAASRGVKNTRVSHHGHTGNARHSPRNGFNGFLRDLPGDRAFLSPSPPRSLLLEGLMPASGHQNHTTLPSADPRARQSRHRRPPHPASVVRDDRDTPLQWSGTESQ